MNCNLLIIFHFLIEFSPLFIIKRRSLSLQPLCLCGFIKFMCSPTARTWEGVRTKYLANIGP